MSKRKEVFIGKKDCQGKDEWYTEWYACPNCKPWDSGYKPAHIYGGASYCPDCGVKLNWGKEK